MPPSVLNRVRKLALALPEANEVEAWGAPTFRGPKKLFAMFANAESHHGDGRAAVWIKAAPGNQAMMIVADPDRFFSPPYVGPGGWIGVYLDRHTDWSEVADLLQDGWRLVAPKKLLAATDAGVTIPPPAKRPRRG